jgi:hypothetical protein
MKQWCCRRILLIFCVCCMSFFSKISCIAIAWDGNGLRAHHAAITTLTGLFQLIVMGLLSSVISVCACCSYLFWLSRSLSFTVGNCVWLSEHSIRLLGLRLAAFRQNQQDRPGKGQVLLHGCACSMPGANDPRSRQLARLLFYSSLLMFFFLLLLFLLFFPSSPRF